MTLGELIGKEAAEKIQALGLHKVAAARLRAEGHAVGDELDLRSAVQALGTNVFVKNAEFKRILEGLVSLDTLIREV